MDKEKLLSKGNGKDVNVNSAVTSIIQSKNQFPLGTQMLSPSPSILALPGLSCDMCTLHLQKCYLSNQLSFFSQDALYREQMLENKLANLQRLLSDSQAAAEDNTQVKIILSVI